VWKQKVWEDIHSLIEVIWASEKMPDNWRTAVIWPIHRKGDKLRSSNYRGISLLNIFYKMLTNILHRRSVPYAEEILGDYQSLFRKGQSTADNLFTLRRIVEKF